MITRVVSSDEGAHQIYHTWGYPLIGFQCFRDTLDVHVSLGMKAASRYFTYRSLFKLDWTIRSAKWKSLDCETSSLVCGTSIVPSSILSMIARSPLTSNSSGVLSASHVQL
jgi:hypothetical protein